MSYKLQQHGFEVIAVDWVVNRHKPKILIVRVNLTAEKGQQLLLKVYDE